MCAPAGKAGITGYALRRTAAIRVRFEEINRLRLAIFSDLEILLAETEYRIPITFGRNNIYYDFASRRFEKRGLIHRGVVASPLVAVVVASAGVIGAACAAAGIGAGAPAESEPGAELCSSAFSVGCEAEGDFTGSDGFSLAEGSAEGSPSFFASSWVRMREAAETCGTARRQHHSGASVAGPGLLFPGCVRVSIDEVILTEKALQMRERCFASRKCMTDHRFPPRPYSTMMSALEMGSDGLRSAWTVIRRIDP